MLLLDLDDTLLNNPTNIFIPAYFQAFSEALAEDVAPDVVIPVLMGAILAMMDNMDPALTLQEVFESYFFSKFNIDRHILQEKIDHFYDEAYPRLCSLTKPIPEAVRLVEWAFEQGHCVVIATDPVFPQKAVQHRLRWAGLPLEKYPFALVTSYETFHFTKKKVAYYPEILAQLGWPDLPAVMVGDDIEREIKPTQAAGLPVFWARQNGEVSEGPPDIPQGSLDSFRDWLKKTDPDSLKISFENFTALLAELRSTPAALATLTASIPPEAWKLPSVHSESSLIEILYHLSDVERRVNLQHIRRVLSEENPYLIEDVADFRCKECHNAYKDGSQELADFIAARKETLELLDSLQAEWSRPARHPIYGQTTLQGLVGFIANHDRAHIQQIWKAI
jgi:FMN phosphatase YigB (HAD superfamily)